MKYAPLESSWAKFHRAGTHLNGLDTELRRLFQDQLQPIDIEHKLERDVAFIRVTNIPEFRAAGLILGDAVTNYRAALDHLAWDLVKLGSKPRPKRPRDIQFPLAKSLKSLLEQRESRLPGVSDERWGVIRLYQPYRRGDTGRSLRLLRDVSDLDKHRYIAPTVMCASGFVGRVNLVNCQGTSIKKWSPKRALYVGAKLLEVGVVLSPGFDIQIESQITVQPSFYRGVAVMPAMLGMRQAVLDILRRFEALL